MKLALVRVACLSAVAAAFLCASSSGQAGGPEGNQDCGTTCNFSTSTPITGTGQSTLFESSFDSQVAQERALADLGKKLARASGVVCMNCDDGLQCWRSGQAGSGTYWVAMAEIPGATKETHGWSCTMAFTGAYTVTCAECPPE